MERKQLFKGPSYYEEEDKNIFRGRSHETEELFYMIKHSDFSVCYASSGEGKSSLINAGLFPCLREESMFPVRIVFDESIFLKDLSEDSNYLDSYIWDKIVETIDNARHTENYKSLFMLKNVIDDPNSDISNTLWWKLRINELRLNSYDTLIIVLIFDQFEEVFTRAISTSWIDEFFCWLEHLYQDENIIDSEQRISLPKNFKLLLSLRSDYVSELDYWSMNRYFIPQLKNNRYCLKPLTKDAACEVAEQLENLPKGIEVNDIVMHAKADRAGDWSKIKKGLPCVSALILSLLLTGLYEKDEEVKNKLEEIISTVHENHGKDLFDFLLEHIYENALKKCGIDYNPKIKTDLESLEDILVDNFRRRRVSRNELLGIQTECIDILKKERIINEIDNHFEISHDSLCNVIAKRIMQRKSANLQNELEEKSDRIKRFEAEQQEIHKNIELLKAKADTNMSDESIDISKRIERTISTYNKINHWAQISSYDHHKYERLLNDYGQLLCKFARYNEAIDVFRQQMNLAKQLYGEKDFHSIEILDSIGESFFKMGDYEKALLWYNEALENKLEVLGADLPEIASSYNNVGKVLLKQGRYDLALKNFNKALKIRDKDSDLIHIDTATSFNNIGLVYDYKGEYDEALKYYVKAANIMERLLGDKHPDIAISYTNIGTVYQTQGKYDQALEFFYKALEIFEIAYGSIHPNIAASYNNIGFVYLSENQNKMALECFLKALNIDEKLLGKDHPHTAIDYIDVGDVYYKNGEHKEALDYYFKALDIREKVLGPLHPDTGSSYNKIGDIYNSQKDYAHALEYYLKALDIRKEALGFSHHDTIISLINIGEAYNSQKDYIHALEYFSKALDIRKNDMSTDKSSIATYYYKIGKIYFNMNDNSNALSHFLTAIGIRKELSDINHPETASSYDHIGSVYYKQGEYDIALEYHFKALEIEEKYLEKYHPNTAEVYYHIGWDFFQKHDNVHALEYISKSLVIYEDKYGPDHPKTIEVRANRDALETDM